MPISHILAGIQIKTLSTFSHYHIPSTIFLEILSPTVALGKEVEILRDSALLEVLGQ